MPARLKYGFGTRAIHAGEGHDPTTGAHGVPIYQNTTYAFDSYEHLQRMRDGHAPHFVYQGRGNPTVRCLEVKLADLEGAALAVATASGMQAVGATLLHLTAGGGHLVAAAEGYDLTHDLLCDELPCHGATTSLVDITDLAAVAAAITPETRAIYTETFSNPTLQVADLDALGALAARHGIPLVVDNTFLSPAIVRPIEHGATIVIHSATKYLSGHGNVQGGVICGPRNLLLGIGRTVLRLGGAMSPFAAWVLLAGVKTLPLRMARHAENAARLATLLAAHPAVERVYYPGLETHPGHDVARRMVGAGGFGGVLSLTLHGGDGAIGPFVNALRLASLAVSLGDCATLVWPFAGTNLIRVAIGIEDAADLEADFAAALNAAADAASSAGGPFYPAAPAIGT